MWLTALIIGFAGSLHCVVMCSPLAMAVTNLRGPSLINRLVYNGGRIICYGLLGALVSTFGSLFSLSGFQNVLTVLLGCALVIVGLAGTRYLRIPYLTNAVSRMSVAIRTRFTVFLKEKTAYSIAMLGVLNGLLPCGLTYLALTYCLTLAGPVSGFTFMLLFGAGTLPVMLGLTSGFQALFNRINFGARNLTTVAMIALGVLLIARSAYVHHHEAAATDEIGTCK